ncbi:MAG TPA: GNAT family N-acetyltransferase [Terriglobales bacterium]|jgi:phosphinothricin acetyltransferase|nr:GNAT family N-acetyltransferase [Terriglobales bacterium]
MERSISIEPLTVTHWEAVRSIYLEGIATGNATFQQTAPDWDEWNAGHLPTCRLIARWEPAVIGWAALSPVSRRPVYRGVAEVSIYVAKSARGCGVGSKLISQLIADSETAGIWTLQAGIFPENAASIELHARAGFRVVGTRSRIGCMNGRWRDVVLMERRSATSGA